jgi:hypothetical protein
VCSGSKSSCARRKQIGDARAVAEFEKRFDQPMLLEQLERARLDADGPRIRVRLHGFVDQTHGNVGTRQTHRCGEPRGSRPDDQHRRRIVCGSVHADLRKQQCVLVYARRKAPWRAAGDVPTVRCINHAVRLGWADRELAARAPLPQCACGA